MDLITIPINFLKQSQTQRRHSSIYFAGSNGFFETIHKNMKESLAARYNKT